MSQRKEDKPGDIVRVRPDNDEFDFDMATGVDVTCSLIVNDLRRTLPLDIRAILVSPCLKED